jgi:hypothetical protein
MDPVALVLTSLCSRPDLNPLSLKTFVYSYSPLIGPAITSALTLYACYVHLTVSRLTPPLALKLIPIIQFDS